MIKWWFRLLLVNCIETNATLFLNANFAKNWWRNHPFINHSFFNSFRVFINLDKSPFGRFFRTFFRKKWANFPAPIDYLQILVCPPVRRRHHFIIKCPLKSAKNSHKSVFINLTVLANFDTLLVNREILVLYNLVFHLQKSFLMSW